MRIKSKKSLGQNFLSDANIRNKIINCLDLKPADIILEIGAGRGELTSLIAERVNKIYSLEIDKRLYAGLLDSLRSRSNIHIIQQDILKLDIARFVQKNGIKTKLKVFGNIPYYISSPIIEHLLNSRAFISAVYITVQKEFAERVISPAGSKEYGSFSCFTQYYTFTKILFSISRNSFRPSPKVDSSFLELKIREKPPVWLKDEALFFKIIRCAFNQRRKILSNSLLGTVSQEALSNFFAKSGLSRNIRPERLTLEDFALLANQE